MKSLYGYNNPKEYISKDNKYTIKLSDEQIEFMKRLTGYEDEEDTSAADDGYTKCKQVIKNGLRKIK